MIKREGLDKFRVMEVESVFYAQQQVHVIDKNFFTSKIRSENDVWENLYTDSILYMSGKTIGFGEFKTKEDAKMAINLYRKTNGWKKKDIKIHEYEK